MSQPVLVGVRFIVIPDGVIEEKNKPRRLRISLAASPHPHGETTIDLRRWPEELAKLSKSLRLIAGNIVDAPGNIDRRDIVATRVISGAVADIATPMSSAPKCCGAGFSPVPPIRFKPWLMW
jgi:hypothetical protein